MEANLFIELLQVSLGARDSLTSVPSIQEWVGMLKEAQRQAIVGVLTVGLERLPQEQRPPQQLLLQWIGISQQIETTYFLQCHRAKELTTMFKESGYDSCVLKGICFSQLYPNPPRRQGGDIDLWVKGGRREIVAWLKNRYEVEHMLWHHIDAKIFDDVPTEIHYHPCWMYNPFCNHRLQKWFDAQATEQMVVDDKLGFGCPSVAFNAVYSLVHSYHHLIEEGLGMRHIIDYYYILKALPVEHHSSVVDLLGRFGLFKLAEAIMWILQDVCGIPSEYLLCKPNEKEGRFLLDEITRGGNFGHYRNDNRLRNSVGRLMALLPHYPREVLWVVPWKMWHRCWIALH